MDITFKYIIVSILLMYAVCEQQEIRGYHELYLTDLSVREKSSFGWWGVKQNDETKRELRVTYWQKRTT